MATYDNAAPPDGWVCEPRPAPVFDLVSRVKRLEVTMPDNIVLGTE